MKRCLTLGISLCLISLLSGCCCGARCGFFRGGCASPCNPCGTSYYGGGFMPFNNGCSSCGTGYTPGFGAPYGTPYGTTPSTPSTYIQPYGTAALSVDGMPIETTGLPPADGVPMTAYGQPTYSPTIATQPVLGQPGTFTESPVTTALMKPDSLATY